MNKFYNIKLLMFITSLIMICVAVNAHEPTWEERQQAIKEIVDAEIAHNRELVVEAAKHRVALDLERAGASDINVSSWSVNRNTITNTSSATSEAK